jgi:hypothetical protein
MEKENVFSAFMNNINDCEKHGLGKSSSFQSSDYQKFAVSRKDFQVSSVKPQPTKNSVKDMSVSRSTYGSLEENSTYENDLQDLCNGVEIYTSGFGKLKSIPRREEQIIHHNCNPEIALY